MKHRAVAGSLAAMSASALVLVIAPAAPAQQDVCAEFQVQEDAQAALDNDPGLAQRQPLIDEDHDGIACETLPHRGGATPTRGTPRQTG
jgi:Excalibur calcium-binding domain